MCAQFAVGLHDQLCRKKIKVTKEIVPVILQPRAHAASPAATSASNGTILQGAHQWLESLLP